MAQAEGQGKIVDAEVASQPKQKEKDETGGK